MNDNIKRLLENEEQNPKALEMCYEKVKHLLMNGEEVKYIAVQKLPIVNLSPGSIVLTSKRLIIIKYKNFGFTMEFQDYIWKEIVDCHIRETFLGTEFTVETTSCYTDMIDYLPKAQARKLYQFAQEQEEIHHEYRRNRELEARRATAGGVVVTANLPTSQQSVENGKADEPMVALKQLKTLLDNNLISQQEFDSKKSEILSRI
jgi:hypothetical protein